ncbi:MAG: glycosyltransferase [Methylococcales bacterium]|jgi:glycosyltransferase involved in cell wall biosynthesis|nr:glycosyltransferase [Methylococcales bacterium]MBT7443129.1 glycosyltransferase [Methylococcales bacterium]
MPIDSTVIIATYNRKGLLKKTLLALARQTSDTFDVIVASDGSSDGSKEMVLSLRSSLPYSIQWIEQEDDGFRKSLILNKAALIAKGKQLVFLDDDCIPCLSFVSAHQQYFQANALVFAKFIGVRQKYRSLFEDSVIDSGEFERVFNWLERLDLWFWHIKYQRWIKQNHPVRPKLNGCNFSVCKTAMLAVNGYDLDFTGWGFEDNDLRRRLLAQGVVQKEAVYTARVYNLATDKFKDETGIASTVQHVDEMLRDNNKAMSKDIGRPLACTNGLNQINVADIEIV